MSRPIRKRLVVNRATADRTEAINLYLSKGRMKNRAHSLELIREAPSLFFASC
jgi:hypothetical protein